MVELLFTTSTIWTVPKDWTNQNIIEVYGGGGGCTSWFSVGGVIRTTRPGYSGGYNYVYNTSQLRPGDRVSIAVGIGGSGGIGSGQLLRTFVTNTGLFVNYFANYNFVGQYGGSSDITNLDRGVGTIISASRGGPGVVRWTNQINQAPFIINEYYPALEQTMPGRPNSGPAGVESNWIRYTPILDGLITKRPEAGLSGFGGRTVNQSGNAGIVAISYISSTTHSPCVWIS
jgi:hypothetical protein